MPCDWQRQRLTEWLAGWPKEPRRGQLPHRSALPAKAQRLVPSEARLPLPATILLLLALVGSAAGTLHPWFQGLGPVQAAESLSTSQLSGSLDARLNAAQAELGPHPGTIRVDTPGTLSTPFTLAAGHSLLFLVPVQLNAPVMLAGQNEVSCSGAAASLTALGQPDEGIFRPISGARQITVQGCTVSSNGMYLLRSWSVEQLAVLHNSTRSTGLVQQGPGSSSDIRLEGNSVLFPVIQDKIDGALIYGAFHNVSVFYNRLEGAFHGIQLFAGDGDGNHLPKPRMIVLADILAAHGDGATLQHNSCRNVNGACLWGSMMNHVLIADNTADGCGDTCFDAEASSDVQIARNTATHCYNFCFSLFFGSYNNSIEHNHATLTGTHNLASIALKNASSNPVLSQGASFIDNTIDCQSRCTWLLLEASDHTTIAGNTVTNGSIQTAGLQQAIQFTGNTLRFPLAGSSPGLALGSLANGSTALISGNQILATAPQAAPCLAQSNSDGYAVDTVTIESNTCTGPWQSAVELNNAAANPAVHPVWIVRHNSLPSLQIRATGVGSAAALVRSGNCVGSSCEPQ